MAYMACGWNKRNVKGMMEYFAKGELPTTNRGHQRGNGSSTAPQEPAGYAGIRQWMQEEGIEHGNT